MTRRQVLAVAGSAPAWLSSPSLTAQTQAKTRMGGAPTAFNMRMAAVGRGPGGFDIVEHCRGIGLAGVQTNPPSTAPEAVKKFRARLEAYSMHLICDPRLPRDAGGVAAFETQIKAFKEAGAAALHVALTGRRYEDMSSLDAFKKSFEQHQKSVELAEPILRKYQIKLGVENHKGWRAAEQAAWMKRVSSEWVGVCLDFGNNVSLCEDPMETLRLLAPYTVFAHVKDMAVQEYEDGFLLSEVVMGEGFLDLKQIVQTLRQKDPNMLFYLEMITRDPLQVPIFTDKYWVSFDDSYSPLPGRDLARVLSIVRKNHPKSPLPRTTGLSAEERAKLEDQYNLKCIEYARQTLNI